MTDTASPALHHDRPTRIDLVDPELYAGGDPHSIWRWLRANQPVYRHPPGRGLPGFWALTRYRDVAAVLSDAEHFSSAAGILLRPDGYGPDPGGGHTLALTDPPRHRKLRALVNAWFTERSVRDLRPHIHTIVAKLLDEAAERETVEFVDDIAAKLPLFVICKLFGVPDEDREDLFLITSQAFCADDPGVRRYSHIQLMDYLGRLADRRRADPRDDIISALACAEIDGRPLTENELLLNCDNVFVGGTENVRIAASGGLLEFMRHPAQWRSLGSDPSRRRPAVEEVLRWTSTPTHILRTTVAPVVIGHQAVGAGERVALWLPSANRDEDVFESPDTFDIERTPNRHLALGTGEHFCLGANLARAELQILYGELAGRFDVEPAGEPTLLSSIVVNGPRTLPVRLTPAH
jgi:cytochrome P450